MRACDSHSLIWRKVRDSNPRYDVMRTPHFECGSFDHSDNFPYAFGQKRVQRYCFFLNYANFFAKKRCRLININKKQYLCGELYIIRNEDNITGRNNSFRG